MWKALVDHSNFLVGAGYFPHRISLKHPEFIIYAFHRSRNHAFPGATFQPKLGKDFTFDTHYSCSFVDIRPSEYNENDRYQCDFL
jgi:hypothetical protein